MYAVIKTGKQYQVKEGDILKVEKLDLEQGAKFDFWRSSISFKWRWRKLVHQLLKELKLREVLEHGRGKKIVVF